MQEISRVLDPVFALLPVEQKEFCTSRSNTFLFSKELIMRFFQEPHNADCLMVILAAHPTNDNDFKAGQPTVITAGCKLKETKEDGTRVYETTNDDKPANEHPPADTIIDFPPGPQPLDAKILFTVK